jgi:phage FluMu protein Com
MADPRPLPRVLIEARCEKCNRLLGRDVTDARFKCPRCKAETTVAGGQRFTK